MNVRKNLARAVTCVFATVIAFALLLPAGMAAASMQPLSAGVSKEDRAPHPEYPAKFVFAMADGAYLARIHVMVTDASGKEVLTAKSDGPWLFVDLPPGEYGVKATREDGTTASAMCNIVKGRQAVVLLTWKGKA